MNTVFNVNNIERAEELINGINQDDTTSVKFIKKEKGLIERTELDNKKVILVEDNRQIILG